MGNITPWGKFSCPSLCPHRDTPTRSPKAGKCVPGPSPPFPQVMLSCLVRQVVVV